MQNNISFTSNINFVSARQFRKVVHKSGEYIPFNDYGTGKFCSVSSSFYTKCVRTCTAGGVIDSKTARGFHIKDSFENVNNIGNIYHSITENIEKPFENVLLIGSKNLRMANYSTKIFGVFKNIFSKKSKNISYFETFNDNRAEAHIHYSRPKDTWTVNVQIFDRKKENYYSILTKEDLLKSFKNISVGKKDKIFINGEEVNL